MSDAEDIKISNDALQRLKKSQEIAHVEKEAHKIKIVVANPHDDKGIVEFECLSAIKYVSIEMILREQLLSGIGNVNCVWERKGKSKVHAKVERKSEL